MIHSLSGGVIRDNGLFTFVQVELDGAHYWYLSPFSTVKEGDKVVVPFGKGDAIRHAVVVKVEENTEQCAPVPMNRIKEIEEILNA